MAVLTDVGQVVEHYGHEYASRLVERGVPLAQVRDLLGHASITTTERYDNQKLENLQLAAARLETGKSFDPTPRDSQSRSICQVFVKNAPDQRLSDDSEGAPDTATNSQDDQALEIWLGGRNSNPDNVVRAAFAALDRGTTSAPATVRKRRRIHGNWPPGAGVSAPADVAWFSRENRRQDRAAHHRVSQVQRTFVFVLGSIRLTRIEDGSRHQAGPR